MHHCVVDDERTQLLPSTQRRYLDDGTLVVPGRLARAGNTQKYRAGELGLDKIMGVGADQVVTFLRPREEVFAADAIASANGKTLTLQHPSKKKYPDGVTVDNWRTLARGHVQDTAQDGDHLMAMLYVRDRAAIKSIETRQTTELSSGYGFDADLTPGKTDGGEAYDGIMRNLRFNHHALVDAARGGPGCRVADDNHDDDEGERPMAMKLIARDSLSVELEDGKAEIVNAILAVQDSKLATLNTEKGTLTTRAQDAESKYTQAVKDLAARDTQIAELKAKVPTEAQIEVLAQDRAALELDAKALAPSVTCAGKGSLQVRREVVAAVIAGDKALAPIAQAVLTGAGKASAADAEEPTLKAAMSAVLPMLKRTAGDKKSDAAARALAGAGGALDGKGPTRAQDGAIVPTPEGVLMRNMQRGFRAEAPTEIAE